MKTELRACWYRIRLQGLQRVSISKPKGGWFHQFAQNFVEFKAGPGNYPVAIVEDKKTGQVFIVLAEDVCFGSEPIFMDMQ